MQMFNGKVVCPRCDGNGLVYQAEVVDLKSTIYICNECDASWTSEEIQIDNFEDVSIFFESKGLSYLEAQIMDLEYYWKK